MTNTQIIADAKRKLVAAGKIKVADDLHTYRHWKKLGYQVFRGEKAVAALNIWQYFQRPEKGAEGDDEKQPVGRMRLKKAFFFSSQQVFSVGG